MNSDQKNIVIGTAGHAAHGKTALIKVLRGIDAGRLREEKERGMTIEPGFACLKLPSGKIVSIVDVPGHERFIRNMLRGISEVDAVILVVAADDGVMPQTREHLDILKLLGIERGLIVLSKIDLVDKEILNMAIEDVARLVEGTLLKDAPLIRYSSKTGEGIDDIRTFIENLTEEVLGKDREGIFRLRIDKVFTMAGYGTVVTGTIVSGKIARGDEIEIYPSGTRADVRYVQVRNQFLESAFAGQRVGLSLPDIRVEELERGMVLGEPNSLISTYVINGKFHYLESNSKPLQDGMEIKLYSGASEVIAGMVLIGKKNLFPGESSFVQLRLTNKLSLCPYDRYIVRSLSPIATIGGGIILEISPSKYRVFNKGTIRDLKVLEQRKDHENVEMFIKKGKFRPVTYLDLSKRFGLAQSEVESMCESLYRENRVILLEDDSVVHKNSYENLREEVLEKLRKFHEENSVRDDISQEEIRSGISSSIDIRLFESVLRELYKDGMIVRRKGKIKLARSQRTLNPKQKLIYDQLDGICKWYRFRPLPLNVFKEIKDRHGDREVEIVLNLMMGEGKLIKLNNHRLIHSESIEEIKRILKGHIEKRGQVVLGESMEVLGVGRAQAQPIFDYLDSIRFTMRIGDYRVLHKSVERRDSYIEKCEIRANQALGVTHDIPM